MSFKPGMEIRTFEFVSTKALRYFNRKVNVNQLIFVALSTGELIVKNPLGDLLLSFHTDLGDDIMGIASPQTTDEAYFGILTTKGHLKIYNYTIIEN